MQLGKALVGAIIGAALGIGLLVAVYLAFAIDQVWLAIPVAILTGLGVRMMVSTGGHASYARGALTGLLALAAYVLGWLVVKEVAENRAAAAPQRSAVVAKADDAADEADESDAKAADARPVEQPLPVQRPASGAPMRKAAQPGQNPLDYVWLGIAALVAYELGRGTAAKQVVVVDEDAASPGAPVGTRPDA